MPKATDGALGSLTWWGAPNPWLEMGDLSGPFQTNHSVIHSMSHWPVLIAMKTERKKKQPKPFLLIQATMISFVFAPLNHECIPVCTDSIGAVALLCAFLLALVGGTLSPSGSGMERWVFLCWLSRRVCRAVLQAEMLLRLLGGWCCRQVGADG